MKLQSCFIQKCDYFFFIPLWNKKKKFSSFLIILYNRQYTPTEIIQTAFIFCIFNMMLEFLKPLPRISYNMYYITISRNFQRLSFDYVTIDDVNVARDVFTKRMATNIVFQRLKISLSISIFDRHIFNDFVATVIRETNILVIFNVFMKYSALISSQNMMFNNEIHNNGGPPYFDFWWNSGI